jgi:hypothetical protein
MRTGVLLLWFASAVVLAGPQDAERFTHIAGFNLADSPSFGEIAATLGPATIRETGDASEYDARVCYLSADRSAVVEFFHGEVTWGFVMRLPVRADDRCTTSSALNVSALNVAGVILLMHKDAYVKIVGTPTTDTNTRVTHEFGYVHVLTDTELTKQIEDQRKVGLPPINPEDSRRWDVGISLVASFVKGRLISFTADRTETN